MEGHILNETEFLSTNTCLHISEYLAQSQSDWTTFLGVRITVSIIYASIFFVGIIGNAGVIVRVIRDRKLHSAQYIFLINLMASDFLLCLTSVPFTPIAVIMKHWVFGELLCRAIPLCQAMSVVITSLSLTAIAVDKYIHIMDPTKPPVTVARASLATGVIWVLACGLSVPLVLSYAVKSGDAYIEEFGVSFCGQYCDEWATPAERRIYGTVVMCIQFVVPMLIIAFCYSSIMHKVQQDMMIENKQFAHSLSTGQRFEAIRRKRKVTFILIMMVVAFVGSWAPLTLFNIFRDYGQLPLFITSQPYLAALLVNSTAMSSVIWNPLLFFWLTGSKQRGSRGKVVLPDSALVSFLLALNPIRMVMNKRRSKQSENEKCISIGNGPCNSTSRCNSSFTKEDYQHQQNVCSNDSNAKMSTSTLSPVSTNSLKCTATFDRNSTKRSDSPRSNASINLTLKPRLVYYSNGKKRTTPSSLEIQALLPDMPQKSPQAPRVKAESLSDLSVFDTDESINTYSLTRLTNLDIEDRKRSRTRTEKGKKCGGFKKSLVYFRIGKSSLF